MTVESLRIRGAVAADVDAVVALVESAYRGESSRTGWTSEADLLDGQRTDDEEVRSVLAHIVLAEAADGIVACCTLVPKDGHAYFGMFAVRPGMQGTGVGSLLLAEAERRAAAAGLAEVTMTVLTTRTELIAFYERRGYADTGERAPFPYGNERFGVPRRDDLEFLVLAKTL